MILITCCFFTVPAFAVNASKSIPSDSDVKAYTLNFMTKSQNNDNISVDKFIHLYNTNGNISGYYVTFTSSGNSA